MGKQGGHAIQIDDFIVAQQADAGLSSKPLANQEVPIAVLEVYLGARFRKPSERGLDLPVRGLVVVVAEIGIEKIPQYVQPLGIPGTTFQKPQETLCDFRPCATKVQIGDEQRFVFQSRRCSDYW